MGIIVPAAFIVRPVRRFRRRKTFKRNGFVRRSPIGTNNVPRGNFPTSDASFPPSSIPIPLRFPSDSTRPSRVIRRDTDAAKSNRFSRGSRRARKPEGNSRGVAVTREEERCSKNSTAIARENGGHAFPASTFTFRLPSVFPRNREKYFRVIDLSYLLVRLPANKV